MKASYHVRSLFLLVFCTLFFSCGEDSIITDTITFTPEVRRDIFTSEVRGQVIDEDNLPVENVSVLLKDKEVNTDANGYFEINDVFLTDNGSLISFSISNYYEGYKLVYPEETGSNFVKVELITKELSATFSATEDFTTQFDTNANLSFSANSIQTTDGQTYTGEVRLFTHWYDPTDINLANTMPGDLRAISAENELVQLATYGMMAVEIETPNGQKLNLDPSTTATLQFPLPDNLNSSAPSTIPMWSFDENSGSWIEEGMARKEGAFYIAEVSHFSFWNCDAPFPIVTLQGQFVYPGDIPMGNYTVSIKVTNDETIARSGTTNGDGIFKGKVPKDMGLTISLVDDCDNVFYSNEIAALSEDSDLGLITIDESNGVVLSGSLVDCNMLPITNGYVTIIGDNLNVLDFFTEDGSFSKVLNGCNNERLLIRGYDFTNLKESEDVEVDLMTNETSYDVGAITLCDNIDEFFILNVEDFEELVVVDPRIVADGAEFILRAIENQDSTDFSRSIEITLANIDIGTQMPNRISIQFFAQNEFGFFDCRNDCTDFSVDITESSNVIEGSFSGMLETIESTVPGIKNITGSFKVNK